MRQIKFRVWYITGKEMISPDLYWFEEEGIREVPGDAYGYQVMQFTGLTDRLGKDIFEGDILSHPGSSPWLVAWGKIGLGDHEIDCHGWLVPQGLEGYEIIGNLYENGDLLK